MEYLLPLIGALIGWSTNYLAVRMLFRPRRPRRFLFFTVQGVFPKRQVELAGKIGELVSEELLAPADVKRALQEQAASPRIAEQVEECLGRMLAEKLPTPLLLVTGLLQRDLGRHLRAIYQEQLTHLIEQIVEDIGDRFDQVLDVRSMVRSKVAHFSSEKVEQLILGVMHREFRFIELMGALLGFLIGGLQVLLLRL